jgi:hypothetical protein
MEIQNMSSLGHHSGLVHHYETSKLRIYIDKKATWILKQTNGILYFSAADIVQQQTKSFSSPHAN